VLGLANLLSDFLRGLGYITVKKLEADLMSSQFQSGFIQVHRARASYFRLVQSLWWWMSICISVNKLGVSGGILPLEN